MKNPNLCPDCEIPAPDGICGRCGRFFRIGPVLGLLAGGVLLLAALFLFWCAT